MNDVEKLYSEGKLLVRAMDQPTFKLRNDSKFYECQSWVDEFTLLMKDGLESLSTTLIVPNVGVRTYKNMGFLVNSEWANCFHITKSDSGSSGSILNGDFQANKADFNTVSELAQYIKNNNAIGMNEVNINVKLDGVVGLFINKSNNMDYLLKKIYIAKEVIKTITGIDYPIYLYDWSIGEIELIELTKDKEEEIINNMESNKVLYWPDDVDEPSFITIEANDYHK